MLTRCPACETHFRVTPEQLKARKGKVRCGACQHVFNAIDTLVEEASAAPGMTPALPDTVPPRSDSIVPEATPAVVGHEAMEVDLPVAVTPSGDFIPPAPTFPEQEAPPADSGSAPALHEAPGDAPAAEAPPEPAPSDDAAPTEAGELDSAAPEQEPAPAPRRWPWALGGLAALLALIAQASLHYRVELAVLAPSARPALEAACEFAGCTVGLPSKVDQMTIETSDLQPHADHPGRLTLAALLRNRAPFAQTWPHLELSLTDTAEKVLVRRVLAPADYLHAVPAAGRAAMIDNGMPPGETPVSLPLQSAETGAAGYRLYLFYP